MLPFGSPADWSLPLGSVPWLCVSGSRRVCLYRLPLPLLEVARGAEDGTTYDPSCGRDRTGQARSAAMTHTASDSAKEPRRTTPHRLGRRPGIGRCGGHHNMARSNNAARILDGLRTEMCGKVLTVRVFGTTVPGRQTSRSRGSSLPSVCCPPPYSWVCPPDWASAESVHRRTGLLAAPRCRHDCIPGFWCANRRSYGGRAWLTRRILPRLSRGRHMPSPGRHR